MYMININYKSHSTLPENLNINAESWATTDVKQQRIPIILLSPVFSASQHVITYTYTPSRLPSSSSILFGLWEEDPLGLNPDYHNYIYLSVFAPAAYLLSLLLTAYTSLENPKSSQTPLSRAAFSNLSTIFNYSLLLTAIPNPALLWQRKCFRIPYITCQASSKRVHF